MVSAHSHRVSRVPWYSGSCRAASDFGYGALTLYGRLFQSRSPAVTESLMQSEPRDARITVWALPRSLAATYGIDVSFSSSGYLDVSVPRVPLRTLWIHVRMTEVPSAGFPHSEISGSKDICSSPKLIAAYHVFHRLLVPRHPPYALTCLTITRIVFSYIPAAQIAFCAPWSRVFLGSSFGLFIGHSIYQSRLLRTTYSRNRQTHSHSHYRAACSFVFAVQCP